MRRLEQINIICISLINLIILHGSESREEEPRRRGKEPRETESDRGNREKVKM